MPEPITRTLMEKFDVPKGAYETVVMVVEMAPHVIRGCTHIPVSTPPICYRAVLPCWKGDSPTSQFSPVSPGAFPRVRCMR